jgi:2-dehydropantoate 2-reductase
MRIAVVGAGAVGMLMAGKLTDVPGTEVRLLTRTTEQAERIRRDGITVAAKEDVVRSELSCEAFYESAAGEPWDWVFLSTKQLHIDGPFTGQLKRLMADRTKLLCFQNGVGHVDRLTDGGIAKARIYVAVTTEGVRKDSDRQVTHTGRGLTAIGASEPCPALDIEVLGAVKQAFEAAGLRCEIEERIDLIVLRKLLINVIINPLTAVLGVRNGELPGTPHTLCLMRSLYDEACPVLQALGLPITEALWEQVLEVCEKTAENTSSMLQDVRAGRPTEIDSITGSLLRFAAKQRLAIPTHEAVYHLVKAL